MTFNKKLSEHWAFEVGALPKMCFLNAANTVVEIGEEAILVEGYAVAKIPGLYYPMEHAWVVQGDDIIDPTWLDGALVYHVVATHNHEAVLAKTFNKKITERTFPIHFPIHKGMSVKDYMSLMDHLSSMAKHIDKSE